MNANPFGVCPGRELNHAVDLVVRLRKIAGRHDFIQRRNARSKFFFEGFRLALNVTSVGAFVDPILTL